MYTAVRLSVFFFSIVKGCCYSPISSTTTPGAPMFRIRGDIINVCYSLRDRSHASKIIIFSPLPPPRAPAPASSPFLVTTFPSLLYCCTTHFPAAKLVPGANKKEHPGVLKVKVGGKAGPSEDAARTVELLRETVLSRVGYSSRSSSKRSRSSCGGTLRLDANQAWTMDEALHFSSVLSAAAAAASASSAAERSCGGGSGGGGRKAESDLAHAVDVDVELVEYIEEPLRDPRLLEMFWERSGKVVPYALDESLGMGREAFSDDVSCCARTLTAVFGLFVCLFVRGSWKGKGGEGLI